MARYRVTLKRTTTEIVEAPNPYQAAIVASERGDGSAEVTDVRPAVGRPVSGGGGRGATRTAGAAKTTKKVTKKRKPLSPEAKARLAQNLVKARAARAAKHKIAQRAAKKTAKKR
jgi:hypothetical protein